MLQVIFQPTRNRWADSILAAANNSKGGSLFADAPDLASQAKHKVSEPLYAVVIRIAAFAPTDHRATEIAARIFSSLSVFDDPLGNSFIPLEADSDDPAEHVIDTGLARTRRTGMLLNSSELTSLVHFPSDDVRSAKLDRQRKKTKAAPDKACEPTTCSIGENYHAGITREVYLTSENRVRHMQILGISGMGKSTLLYRLLEQDVKNGEGFALLDPHGDLVEEVLSIIPDERIDDVVLLDLANETHAVAFNVLHASSEDERTRLAADLVSVFRRLSISWGDRMDVIFRNTILTFLKSERGGTLDDMQRFLLDANTRREFLTTVKDKALRYYWETAFTKFSGSPTAAAKSVEPVVQRLQQFLVEPAIRYLVCQKESTLDFADIMNSGKIFLARLPKGVVPGEVYLLGSLLVSKIQQTAMARTKMEKKSRRDFWLYIDEAHNFLTPSMAEILTETRKYRLGLVLSHQISAQLKLEPEVADAADNIGGARISFRLGDKEAKHMANEFESFDSSDLKRLAIGDAIGMIEHSDQDFNLHVPFPDKPGEEEALERAHRVTEASNAKYATPIEQLRHLVEDADDGTLAASISAADGGAELSGDTTTRRTTLPVPEEEHSSKLAIPEEPGVVSPAAREGRANIEVQ